MLLTHDRVLRHREFFDELADCAILMVAVRPCHEVPVHRHVIVLDVGLPVCVGYLPDRPHALQACWVAVCWILAVAQMLSPERPPASEQTVLSVVAKAPACIAVQMLCSVKHASCCAETRRHILPAQGAQHAYDQHARSKHMEKQQGKGHLKEETAPRGYRGRCPTTALPVLTGSAMMPSRHGCCLLCGPPMSLLKWPSLFAPDGPAASEPCTSSAHVASNGKVPHGWLQVTHIPSALVVQCGKQRSGPGFQRRQSGQHRR